MLRTDKFHDECGVVAIFAHPEAEKLAYLGLHALQHRGQESAGIVTSDGLTSRVHKAMGTVADIFTEDVLSKIRGTLAIGHTRYSTAGDSALLNAQPILVQSNKGSIAVAHNGNLVNAMEVRSRLERQGSIFQTNSDTEVIVHLIALSQEHTLPEAIADALRRVEGAFSLVLMTPDRIIAARDPRGFRPLAMGRIPAMGGQKQDGQKRDTIVFASETCAFDLIGATYERDVKPGELVVVGPEGISSRFYSTDAPQSSCIFEHVYFSRPDSVVFGRAVQTSREELGRQLAREAPVEADLVVPVPDSGVTAAVGYAAESGIPFRFGLIRNHYVGRTFIEPSQSVRDFGVRLKLNPVRSLLEGKRVVLIDDSIVRGTTSRKIVRMIRNAGAKEVHMRISCPPTISPCYYGVDTPSKKQLIAANKSVDEIRQYIRADSLAYLSLEGLKKACGEGEKISYCSACYTGKYPTSIVDVEEIQPAIVPR
ncbi:MAG TPA: amidophosphoribosyltransferase [Candidatus Sulfotelmatobacter sp.]|jgi:amidophosphoribosyltransferase|nr:amidophosphoribosyltransferase [Candidatus Sulfotelmatobacter sp.]